MLPDENTCTIGTEKYCARTGDCWTAGICTGSTRYNAAGPGPGNYVVKHVVSHTITSIGFQYFAVDQAVDNVHLAAGDIIGFEAVVGTIGAASCDPTDQDFDTTDAVTVGSAVTVFNAVSGQKHSLSAITSGSTTVYLPYLFTATGAYTISTDVYNTRIAPNTQTDSALVTVIAGVNSTVIVTLYYLVTGENSYFNLEPHTGM